MFASPVQVPHKGKGDTEGLSPAWQASTLPQAAAEVFWSKPINVCMYVCTDREPSPCIMQCFFLNIHVTKRHLVLYIDVEFNTIFFSSLAVSSAISSLAVKLIWKRRPVSVFGKQAYTTRTTVRLCISN